MPTGYTTGIYNGTEMTLRQYALRCARAMGALVPMRDMPIDAPVPEQLEPNTTYYDEQIAVAQKRLDELDTMNADDIDKAAKAWNAKVEEDNAKRVADVSALRERYKTMIAEVRAWEGAPDGLKEFMLSQLYNSIEFDVELNPLEYAPRVKSPSEWYAQEKEDAQTTLSSARRNRDEEIERTAKRNQWLAQLHAALRTTQDA